MPIYEFQCAACDQRFDKLQKLSDADPTTCAKCGAEGHVSRALTAPQFRLAGGGWYETDFKKDGDRKRNLAGDGSAPKDAGGDAPKADAKPADAKPAASSGGDAKPSAAPAAAATPPKPASS